VGRSEAAYLRRKSVGIDDSDGQKKCVQPQEREGAERGRRDRLGSQAKGDRVEAAYGRS
jgi:hypothetical protein